MTHDEFTQLLRSSGAILEGHFVLTSGRHSNVYFEKFRILEQPEVLTALCAEIADHFRDKGIDVVMGPTTGGIILAFEIARALGVTALYAESVDGKRTLRRNAVLPPGSRVLIVDDVLTTGLSLREVTELVEAHGGIPYGYGVLIDRSQDLPALPAPVHAAYRVVAESYAPNEVPEWLAAIPTTKPGTRT